MIEPEEREMIRDCILAFVLPCLAVAAVIFMQKVSHSGSGALPPMVFVMAVFLVSWGTQGYLWGILASLLSVLAVNFAFTFPYFEFNFSLPENMFSGVVMLFVSIMTSTLTTKLKQQERIRAENEKEKEKEKVRANLLRAVSHDLRTPLTSIYGSCSTIMENYDSLSKEQQFKLLGEVCANAEWLNRMVENLLSVTRIDSEKISVTKTPTVLEELIDAVVVKFKKRYPDQPITVDIPEDFVMIPMDSMLIEQVLVNLLENAVDHAIGMTQLTLRVFTQGDWAIFEVTDNGCGIPKERLATLFSGMPHQDNRPSDSGKRNMGIGLSVCATIIKAHGGNIEARSRAGSGTTIRFSLEREEAEAEDE